MYQRLFMCGVHKQIFTNRKMKYFHENQVCVQKCQMEVPKHQRKKVEGYLFNIMIIVILTNNIWASNVGSILWQLQRAQELCSRGRHR